MNFLSNLCSLSFLTKPTTDVFTTIVRGKARKAVGSCKLQRLGQRRTPKFRGWKKQHHDPVKKGEVLYTQCKLRFHPGLHVKFGGSGTLTAMENGKVVITMEKVDPNWDHEWVARFYERFRHDVPIYKKYYNVIPEEQKNKFVLVDKI